MLYVSITREGWSFNAYIICISHISRLGFIISSLDLLLSQDFRHLLYLRDESQMVSREMALISTICFRNSTHLCSAVRVFILD